MEGRNFLAEGYKPREFVISARDRCDYTYERIRAVVTPKLQVPAQLPHRPAVHEPELQGPVAGVEGVAAHDGRGEMDETQLVFFGEKKPAEELYDLEKDPHEIHNLAGDPEFKAELERHRGILAGWIAETGDQGQEVESDVGLLCALKRWGDKCVNPEYDRVREAYAKWKAERDKAGPNRRPSRNASGRRARRRPDRAMPELPEVETTLRGISPHLVGKRIVEVDIRERRLRWPVPRAIDALAGKRVVAASRRAKYLLVDVGEGTVILHLGMSGSLRLNDPDAGWRKHDHLGLRLSTGKELRFHDPRRFGCVLFCKGDPARHKLIRDLGRSLWATISTPATSPPPPGARGRDQAAGHERKGGGRGGQHLRLRGPVHGRYPPGAPAGKVSAARLARLVAAIKGGARPLDRAGGHDFAGLPQRER